MKVYLDGEEVIDPGHQQGDFPSFTHRPLETHREAEERWRVSHVDLSKAQHEFVRSACSREFCAAIGESDTPRNTLLMVESRLGEVMSDLVKNGCVRYSSVTCGLSNNRNPSKSRVRADVEYALMTVVVKFTITNYIQRRRKK